MEHLKNFSEFFEKRSSILDLIYELCPEYRPEGWGNKSTY